ncbi:MAG: glycosyltransferase [Acidobacteria bacterium]|nr:glycosyltransferase [Acidobacteriota bacterium]
MRPLARPPTVISRARTAAADAAQRSRGGSAGPCYSGGSAASRFHETGRFLPLFPYFDAYRGESAGHTPRTSVIIPAHNAAATLPLCLESVRRLGDPTIETIVVCDGCADNSAAVALRYGARTIVQESREGPSYARNVGALVARGEIFFFLDADCVLQPDALELAVQALDAGEQVVFGSYTAETRAPGFFSQFKNLQHHFTHQNASRLQTSFWSGCGAITRQAFEDLGGFDVALTYCEDVELGYALTQRGYRVRLLESMQVEHLKRYTLSRLLRSDLFGRAIPWTRLARANRAELGKLNTRPGGKRSVACTGMAWMTLAGWLVEPEIFAPAFALCSGGALTFNRKFLAFVLRLRGWAFAAGSALTLLAHFSVAGLGFVLGHLAPRYPAERTPAPRYRWAEKGRQGNGAVAAAKSS